MGAHRAADCDHRHCAHAAVPEATYFLQLPRGGMDSVTGRSLPGCAAPGPLLSIDVRALSGHSGTPLPVSGLSLSDGWPRIRRDGAPIAAAYRNRAPTTSKCHRAPGSQPRRANNFAWYRFQADTGVQAAYTDPINPMFNATSPQPLYSFASGYTHVFSPSLVNYFNPAFSWYESLFGPVNLAKDAGRVSDRAAGRGPTRRSPRSAGSTTPGCRAGARRASSLNDNLAWTVRRHDLRFGTNSRHLRLNDYDFGARHAARDLHDAAAVHLRHCVHRDDHFSLANSQPYNFLNLDLLRAGHLEAGANPHLDVRRTRDLQLKSLESARCHRAPRRGFDAISHDVNQPLNQVIRTGSRQFSPPLRRHPSAAHARSRGSLRRRPCCARVRRVQRLLPGSVVDLVGTNPPYSKTFQGGLLGTAGGVAIAPGSSEQRHRCHGRGESGASTRASPTANFPARRHWSNPQHLPSAGSDYRGSGRQTARALLHAVELRDGTADRQHDQSAGPVCGHARREPALQTQVNGYQTVCEGCFAPFPYGQPTDPRFGPVTQFTTGANSHYNGLQLTAEKRLGHGLQVQANYTWSHCMDTVSNGGFLPFSAGGILSPLPGDAGPPVWTLRLRRAAQLHRASTSIELPIQFRNRHAGPRRSMDGRSPARCSGTADCPFQS